MSGIADDLCAEVRYQCEQAEHFKRLWMQANDELERLRQQHEKLQAVLERIASTEIAHKADALWDALCMRHAAEEAIVSAKGGAA